MDLSRPVTSLKFGELTGISRRRVDDLKAGGILVSHSSGRGLDGVASIKRYCEHLRQQAAGRAEREGQKLDLKQETARLKIAQRRNYDLKNSVLEQTHIPVEELKPAWGRVLRAVRSAVLAIPGRARFALPHLSACDAEILDGICRDQLEAAALGDEPPPPDKDASA